MHSREDRVDISLLVCKFGQERIKAIRSLLNPVIKFLINNNTVMLRVSSSSALILLCKQQRFINISFLDYVTILNRVPLSSNFVSDEVES